MPHRRLARLLCLAVALAPAVAAAPAAAAKGPRVNELQVVGTHNSYKRETTEREQDLYDAAVQKPGEYDATFAYSHAPLVQQLDRQRVRGLELDLYGDPEGGRYDDPLVRRLAGLGPLTDPAWQEPGIKVMHVADIDYETTCVRFVTCLEQVRDWSSAHRRHVPLFILLELKRTEPQAEQAGGAKSPPWDGAALDALDAEIRSVFSERHLLSPDDVRRRGRTLAQSVQRSGWPRLRRARGKVVFLLDNEPGPIRDAYREGRPSLEGRAVFTNADPDAEDAAFVKRNDPLGAGRDQIRGLVRRGLLVRTRSDVPLETVLGGDTTMRRAAFSSGAQVVSTDFPVPGMAARYDSDYFAALPRGLTARCNRVIAPRGCHSARLEPAGLR